MRIILVEDDRSLADGLNLALAQAGFDLHHVTRGGDALHVIKTDPPDMMILDLGLPDMDGFEVLRQARSTLPVLILTARSELDDRVKGLNLGADDYLSKPFAIPELIARLRVIARHLSKQTTNTIQIGNVILDTESQVVEFNGEQLELPRREYALLKTLMENPGRVMTREKLEGRLYNWGDEVSSNALEVHIHQLRKKFGTTFIKTIRGVGYTIKKP